MVVFCIIEMKTPPQMMARMSHLPGFLAELTLVSVLSS
jgi:hypothetical protein